MKKTIQIMKGSICVPETTWKKEKSPSFTICGIEKARKVKHKLLFLAFIFFFSVKMLIDD